VRFQPSTASGRSYDAPTPGSGWNSSPGASFSDVGTPRDSPPYGNKNQFVFLDIAFFEVIILNRKRPHGFSSAASDVPSPYLPSTPGGPPMTPGAPSYLPSTPGGQPMTPGSGGLDAMSPITGEVCLHYYCHLSTYRFL
jgi:transcription elongation factor SPT5